MREIELKARVGDLPALERRLEAAGIELSEPIKQDDAIYFDGDKPFNVHQKCNFVRIRRTPGGASLTLKRSIEDELDSIEHETAVGDPEAAEAMLDELGLKYGVRVKKLRRTFKINGINGCLDSVEGLGDFIELEIITDENSDLETARGRLREQLESLGIGPGDEVTKGYDTLVYEKESGQASD